MNRDQLIAIAPLAAGRVDLFLAPIAAAMERFGIDTPARQAAFLAQILHESAMLKTMSENLNYSPEGILATFNTSRVQRFTKDMAQRYGRTADHPANQQMIANVAYANRMGNGSIESGDGYRFRGRGPGQLTGKDNYQRCGAALGLDLVQYPEQVGLPEVGCLAAGWFWSEGNPACRDLNELADAGEWDAISKAVNGGNNGLAERRELSNRALEVLNG